jgi:hypothetical protein
MTMPVRIWSQERWNSGLVSEGVHMPMRTPLVPILLALILAGGLRPRPVAAQGTTPAAVAAGAQNAPALPSEKPDTWLFENRSYFDPAVAEIHAADVSATLLAVSNAFPFTTRPGNRRVWTISLGKEVPVFGREGRRKGGAETCFPVTGSPQAGCTGWGVWFAIDFHMMEDFRDNSNPIVDTDYRFGGMFKYRHAFTDTQALSLRGYYGHESTHLGDEFSLAAQRNVQANEFQRINVSYQYWEYGVSYDIYAMGGSNIFTIRHLGSVLDPLTSKDGYYSTDPLEVNGHTVTPSKNRYEPAFEFEWRNVSLPGLQQALDAPPGTNVKVSWWRPYVSVDARYRTVFDFAKADPNQADDRQLSTNVIAGYRRLREESKRGEPDFFMRLYYGVNPYGQLRSQRGFFLFGLGLHVFV